MGQRGPKPTGGAGTQVVVRLQPQLLQAVEAWAEFQSDEITRAEAIRRLVVKALRKGRWWP